MRVDLGGDPEQHPGQEMDNTIHTPSPSGEPEALPLALLRPSSSRLPSLGLMACYTAAPSQGQRAVNDD